MNNIPSVFWLIPIASVVALGMAWFFFRSMMKEDEGTDRMKEIAEFLALPENIKPNALIVIGYPAKIPPQPKDRVDEESVKYI